MASLSKNLNFDSRRDHQKNSYERRAYESVDEKSLSLAMSRKTMKKEFGRIKVKFNFCLEMKIGFHFTVVRFNINSQSPVIPNLSANLHFQSKHPY